MKTWVVMVIITLAGMAVGLSITAVESFRAEDRFFRDTVDATPATSTASVDSGALTKPRSKAVVVGKAEYDFGSMEKNSKKSHTFRIRNDGNAPLTLMPGRITCKCTVSDIADKTFAPGETADIKLEWTGKTFTSAPDFYQTAEVITNDPENKKIELKIKGYVTENIRALPDEIALGLVNSNEGMTTEFRLFGFRSETIEIREAKLEDPLLADYIDVAFSVLSGGEVEQEKGATCGLLGTLTVKPGLPLGPITQTIRIDATTDRDVEIQVPVIGRVKGDFQFASSPKFRPTRSLLTLGALKRSESVREVLHLFVTGEYRHDTRLEVGEITPAGYFNVEIAEPVKLNEGKTVKYDITIEVPAGLEPINRLGTTQAEQGCILLETTHPKTKRVPLFVKFAVD